MDDITPIEPSESARIQRQESKQAKQASLRQEASRDNMIKFGQDAAFNPLNMSRKHQTLEEKKRTAKAELKETEETSGIEKIEDVADEFQKRNPELDKRALLMLRARLKESNNTEDMLRHVMKTYPDHSLADEALEFLSETSTGDEKELAEKAKANLNESYGREVRAGRNIGDTSRSFAQQGLGSPMGLRSLYRDITGNPRDSTDLFIELHEQFSYEKLQQAIDFVLHSMGADLRSKGPSISRGELHRLMTEARSLQSILGVYRFFQGRMDLINSAFERNGMLLPSKITFEYLARLFVQFLRERYPSIDKVFKMGYELGLSDDEIAQEIIYGQMRDAVRGVAPKLYRSTQHRNDVLMAFIEALEELEEQIEGDEEEEEEEEESE